MCYSRTDTGETSTASYEYCNLTLTNEDVAKRKFLSDLTHLWGTICQQNWVKSP